jgi:hypothetical protein
MRCAKRAAACGESITERNLRRRTSVEKQYGLKVFNDALDSLCKLTGFAKSQGNPEGPASLG